MKNIREKSLIPQNERDELHCIDFVSQEQFLALSYEMEEFKNLANPLKCKAKYLPFLACAFKVDFWDDSLSEQNKRNLIQSSIFLHRKKGTVWAIEQIFKALDMDASVLPWFKYDGEPYHFKIEVAVGTGVTRVNNELINRLRKYTEIYKSVRDILEEVVVKLQEASCEIQVQSAAMLEPHLSNSVEVNASLNCNIFINKGVVWTI